MGLSWYDDFNDSGAGSFWDEYTAWLDQNKPGRGKYDKQLMKDPANSSLARGANAAIAQATRQAAQNYQVDPEIAAHPELLAAQQNKGAQDIASQGSTAFMNALAGAQSDAASRNAQRKMGIYSIGAQARGNEAEIHSRMMRGVQKQNPFMAALGIASPFLSLIPGIGPALSAGAGALSSAYG